MWYEKFFFVLLFVILFSPLAYADGITDGTRFQIGGNFLRARLDFFNMSATGVQELSVTVSDNQDVAISNASVLGVVTLPNGTQDGITFAEKSPGNYTVNYTFDKIGEHNILVTVSKAGFDTIAGSKKIYVGLIQILSFTGASVVFQGTTAFFELNIRNTGNVSSQVQSILFILDSSNNLVFSKQGLLRTLDGNTTAVLFQHNIVSWNVGSTTVGNYTARAGVKFTDVNNNTVFTPNVTFSFQVLAQASAAPAVPSAPGAGGVQIVQVNVTEGVAIPPPTAEFLQFVTIPVLIETFQGEQRTDDIVLFNPTNETISGINIKIEGIPLEWVSIIANSFSVEAGRYKEINLVLNVPPDAVPGSYQVKIRFSNNELIRDFFFIIRVNPPEQIKQLNARIAQEVDIREIRKETHFVIRVKNSNRPWEKFSIVHRMDKSIASNVDEIVFSQKPSRIIQADPVVQFTFTNFKPFEERNITYFVKKLVNTTAPFITSSIEEVVAEERAKAPPAPLVQIEIQITETTIFGLAVIAIIAVVIVLRIRSRRMKEKVREAKRFVTGR